ncbi:fumarate/nitrate reduction transcriptional regulator Fnr [Gynuella sunshinyii]|uniref:cAMP-binding protein-catabolite gene activator and regulatory subunit of cAMP-dependent protein kinase n=1 Tax=Gynuella sunshinyii YC6258 TaxID=1445510 RepID=A0A0C5VVV4_9GAMM|nr:fumarate/nitrate reduction transcriptional regulator Fnr [Gynuella sunshinyii]AJQ94594.1 cAMP-binding protein - catabolite gene activator and regulatory subunit of cAMP-dependent protein kinase [Gynuella sunshinyii YC6258]
MVSTAHCDTCSLHPLCLPIGLQDNDLDKLEKIIRRGRPIQKGDHLFRQGEPFTSVYAVRTGTLKTYTLTNDGEEQITGFHLASELVGLSNFDTQLYTCSAKALETTNVCEIPFESLDDLSAELPALRRQLLRTMGKEIRDDQQMMLLLSKKSAEERIASFLLNLASRFKRRGFSDKTFRLSMSRADMANYLGLAVETVSRVFTRFQKQDLIEITGNAKEISLLDQKALWDLAALSETERCELDIIVSSMG